MRLPLGTLRSAPSRDVQVRAGAGHLLSSWPWERCVGAGHGNGGPKHLRSSESRTWGPWGSPEQAWSMSPPCGPSHVGPGSGGSCC